MDDSDQKWWDMVISEFFHPKAIFTISFYLDGHKHYTLGRTLIPRFFRKIYEGGVVDLHFITRMTEEMTNMQTGCLHMECKHTSMIMQHVKPCYTKVSCEGYLVVEFNVEDMLIRNWHFSIKSHSECIPKQFVMNPHSPPDELYKHITRCGLPQNVLSFLKLCVILEPMRELMSGHKTYNMDPHECLKNCLFHKWQRITASEQPPRSTKSGRNPRRRKNSTTTGGSSKKKNFQPPSSLPPPSNVMLVEEPTLMESFGEDDERTITRHENDQFVQSQQGTPIFNHSQQGTPIFSQSQQGTPVLGQPNLQSNGGRVKSESQQGIPQSTDDFVGLNSNPGGLMQNSWPINNQQPNVKSEPNPLGEQIVMGANNGTSPMVSNS